MMFTLDDLIEKVPMRVPAPEPRDCGYSTNCWIWQGKPKPDGYGNTCGTSAHRRVWVAMVGPLDHDIKLDHLCRTRLCVNPAHLEPVLHGENIRRGYAARDVDVSTAGAVRAIRHALEMTQEEFAALVGVSRISVQQWEKGTRAPRRDRREVMIAATTRRANINGMGDWLKRLEPGLGG